MGSIERISTYDSQSPAYHQAFEVFLAHTDQKTKAREWLRALVNGLSSREVFVDAGAGNGKVTAWFLKDFRRTFAIEPSPSLCQELRRTCPTAEVFCQKILDVRLSVGADLVLCSHVLYYIDAAEWMNILETLATWVAPKGVLIVVVQNHNTDCMRMLGHFFGYRFHFTELARQFGSKWGGRYRIEMETVPAQVTTEDFDPAFTVAEFMLNLLPISQPPAREMLEHYVHRHFARSGGLFSFSCDQDFLMIHPRGEHDP